MYEYLNRRYALAFYSIANEKNKIEEYMNEMKDMLSVVSNNAELLQVIKHPQISTSRKKEIFKSIFEGKISEDLLSFYMTLMDKNRVMQFKNIIDEYQKIFFENRNILITYVKTAVPLLEEERKTLIDKLQNKYHKTIELNEEVDKSIIGGVFIKIDDDVIDGTVKHRLYELKKLMINDKYSLTGIEVKS